MSLTTPSFTSFSISLHTPSMSKPSTSPALGGLCASSLRWKGQWICHVINCQETDERWVVFERIFVIKIIGIPDKDRGNRVVVPEVYCPVLFELFQVSALCTCTVQCSALTARDVRTSFDVDTMFFHLKSDNLWNSNHNHQSKSYCLLLLHNKVSFPSKWN